MVSVSKQSRFVPYIVEVDKLGQVAAVRPASVIDAASLTGVVKAELATFITKARFVTPDQQLQANSIRDVYALLANSDPATAKMNEWFNGSKENNPFFRASKVLVSASINGIIPQSQDSWQVDWTETVTTRDGHPESVTNLRALDHGLHRARRPPARPSRRSSAIPSACTSRTSIGAKSVSRTKHR